MYVNHTKLGFTYQYIQEQLEGHYFQFKTLQEISL